VGGVKGKVEGLKIEGTGRGVGLLKGGRGCDGDGWGWLEKDGGAGGRGADRRLI
jgi:hypothetical protein